MTTEAIIERKRLLLYKTAEERRALAPLRANLKRRHAMTDWPLDSVTLERADYIDHGDVMAPPPPEPPSIAHYQALAATFGISNATEDPNLAAFRHNEHLADVAARNSLRGAKWTPAIIDARLKQGFDVLLRERGSSRPRAFGSSMPKHVVEMSDQVAQAENGELRRTMSRLLRKNAHITAEEGKRAAEALCWPAEFLGKDELMARYVNWGAQWRAMGVAWSKQLRKREIVRSEFYRIRALGVEKIVAGLAAQGRSPI